MDNENLSYVPYSRKPRSCYILGRSGTVYPGVRVENISFPITIPAIQAAVSSCLGNGDLPDAISIDEPAAGLEKYWINELGLNVQSEGKFDGPLFSPLLDREPENIPQFLLELCELCVIPESGFPVSALLKTSKGWIAGVNVEFDDWNLGLCAERVALSRAISAGITEFERIHIYAPESDFCSPCGSCRQVLYELMPDGVVELHHDDVSLTTHQVSHLLPFGFTTRALKKS